MAFRIFSSVLGVGFAVHIFSKKVHAYSQLNEKKLKNLWDKVERFGQKCGVKFQERIFTRKKWCLIVGDMSSGKSSLINACMGVVVRHSAKQAVDDVFTIIETVPEDIFEKILLSANIKYDKTDLDRSLLNKRMEGNLPAEDVRNKRVYYRLTPEALKIRYAKELNPLMKHLPTNNDYELMVQALVVNEKYIPVERREFLSKTIFLDSPGFADIGSRGESLYSTLNCCIHFFSLCSFIAILLNSGQIRSTSKDTLQAVKLAKTVPLGSKQQFDEFKRNLAPKKMGIIELLHQAKDFILPSEHACGLLFTTGAVRFYLSKFDDSEGPIDCEALYYDAGALLAKTYHDLAPKADKLSTISALHTKSVQRFINTIQAMPNASVGATGEELMQSKIDRLLDQILAELSSYNPFWFNIFAESKKARTQEFIALQDEKVKLFSEIKDQEK